MEVPPTHPNFHGIFREINHPAMGVPRFFRTPPYITNIINIPFIIQNTQFSYPMNHENIPLISRFWKHPLDSKDPIFSRPSFLFLAAKKWNSSQAIRKASGTERLRREMEAASFYHGDMASRPGFDRFWWSFLGWENTLNNIQYLFLGWFHGRIMPFKTHWWCLDEHPYHP